MTYLGTKDFLCEVQEGNVTGYSMVHKFGRNGSVPDGSWEFVNSLGFTGWPLSAATTVRIKAGGSANDTAAGSGAREVTVQGIDNSFNEVTETIATAGASASSNTTTLFWRVHRVYVSACGTYGEANAAAVVVENSGGGTDLIQIGSGKGQTQFAGWTVPGGKTAYLLSVHAQVDTNQSAYVGIYTRADIDVTSPPVKSKRLRAFFAVVGSLAYSPDGPEMVIPAKSDIWIEAAGDGGIVDVTANFELLVIEN